MSLFDREGLTAAFAGHDAVVNLASALPPTHQMILMSAWTENHRVRAEGSANVVDAALKVGIPRLIQESIVMIYRDGGDRWIDEDWPTDRFPTAAGNHAAEANAQRFAHGGGAAVILRFGIFYGLGAAHSEQIMALARRHIGFQAGRPTATSRQSMSPTPPTRSSPPSNRHPVSTASSTTNPSPHVTTPTPWLRPLEPLRGFVLPAAPVCCSVSAPHR